ncbi:MAG TPA: hypothetical protein VK699_15775 [Terriglobales bacterium]|jgi:hypothetical protein|nr:hypothetical protein [Terriglobales bacterium]
MNQTQQYGMQCSEFETLLTEAVESSLAEEQMQNFRGHATSCPACAALFAEALAGYQWLRSLEPVEAPVYLAHNILAATTGVIPASTPAQVRVPQSRGQQLGAWLRPLFAPLRQPRFAATFAMAFFSVTLMLNLVGFNPLQVDWRPGALRSEVARAYYTNRTRVVRYYDSMRFVYELQARMREIKSMLPEDTTQQPQQQQREEKKEKNNKDISVQPETDPEQKQENYAQQGNSPLLASYALHEFGPPYFVIAQNRRTA